MSGLLPSKTTPEELKVSSMFINTPIGYDNNFETIEVDILCN
jgi:hypothetical protein